LLVTSLRKKVVVLRNFQLNLLITSMLFILQKGNENGDFTITNTNKVIISKIYKFYRFIKSWLLSIV
jgi:hypothetical protein